MSSRGSKVPMEVGVTVREGVAVNKLSITVGAGDAVSVPARATTGDIAGDGSGTPSSDTQPDRAKARIKKRDNLKRRFMTATALPRPSPNPTDLGRGNE